MSTIQLSSSPPGRPRSPAAARPPKRGEFSMLPPACFRSASSSVRLCKPCHCHSQVTCKDRSIPLASHARRTRPCCGFFFTPLRCVNRERRCVEGRWKVSPSLFLDESNYDWGNSGEMSSDGDRTRWPGTQSRKNTVHSESKVLAFIYEQQ